MSGRKIIEGLEEAVAHARGVPPKLIEIDVLRQVQKWRVNQWPCRDETGINSRGACLRCSALRGECCMRSPAYGNKKASAGDKPRLA